MTDDEMLHLLVAEDFCRMVERELGAQAYIVGGAVRNIVTGKPVSDVDIAISDNVLALSEKAIVTDAGGGIFGSYKIQYRDHNFDVSRMRGDEVYEGGKLVELLETADSETDAGRRDFGINTGYLRLSGKGELTIHDPIGLFWPALEAKEIGFVGNAGDRIKEDPHRMLRAFRLAAQMEWLIEMGTLQAIKDCAEVIAIISPERIREELNKILLTNRIHETFKNLYESGLLSFILPEVHYAMSVEQNKHHGETVGEHLLLTASAIRKPNLLLRWAALLHDIAKPKVRAYNKKKKDYTFYNHEVKSAFDAKAIMRRLKFSNKEIDYVFRIIMHHMYYITDRTKLSTVRRFMHRAGSDIVRDILRLRIADRVGNLSKSSGITRHLKMLLKMIRKVEKEDGVMKVTDLKVDGHDMMSLGLEKEEIGKMLKYLHGRCLRNPKLNTKEKLTKIAKGKI